MSEALVAKGCEVTGFERDPARAAEARRRCPTIHVGDLESDADLAQLEGPFDVILFGDVLEHLRAPTRVLASVRSLLSPGGQVVTSIPNIGVWRGRWATLRGRFDYTDSGLFDRTHLRFFTRSSAHRMVRDAGYRIAWERFARDQPPSPVVLRRYVPDRYLDAACDRLADGWPELFALQFVLALEPLPSSA